MQRNSCVVKGKWHPDIAILHNSYRISSMPVCSTSCDTLDVNNMIIASDFFKYGGFDAFSGPFVL